jgi:hypothetical protein
LALHWSTHLVEIGVMFHLLLLHLAMELKKLLHLILSERKGIRTSILNRTRGV